MISKDCNRICSEDLSLIENYQEAIRDTKTKWVLHHRDEYRVLPSGIEVWRSKDDLKENGRYFKVPANELIFLTPSDHTKLHNKNPNQAFKNSSIQKELSSRPRKMADLSGEKNPKFGKDAWKISCSRKTPEQIEATRQSKREKMKAFWAANKEKRLEMARKVSESKRQKGDLSHDEHTL